MASKRALMAAVGVVSAFSVGAGTFLAYRANKTPTPIIEATATATQEPFVPAPAPDAMVSVAPPTVSHPPAVDSAPASPKPQPRREPAPQSRADARTTPAAADPVTPNAQASQPTRQVTASAPAATTQVAPPDPTPLPATTAAAVEAPPVPEPPSRRFEELIVKEDSVVGIELDQSVSSETAKVEDRITGKVTRDVTVDGRTAIAAGTKLEGVVSSVQRGGKFRERAQIGIRFNTLILPDGLRVPIQTNALVREGDSPAGEATAKIGGGAVAGAIVGGLIGGKRGAVIGTGIAAAGGTAAVAAGGRNAAVFQRGSPLTVKLTAPVTITIERELSVR